MKNTKFLYLVIIVVSVLACNQKQKKQSDSENVINKEVKTVKIVAQQRPFG